MKAHFNLTDECRKKRKLAFGTRAREIEALPRMNSILRLVTVSRLENTASFFVRGVGIGGGWVMKEEAWHAFSDAAAFVDAGEGRRLVAMPQFMSASSERPVDGFEILRLLDGDLARLRQEAPNWVPAADEWRKKIARVAEPQAQAG